IFALACASVVVLAVLVLYFGVVGFGALAQRIRSTKGATPASRQAALVSLALRTLGGGPAAVVLLAAALVGALVAAAAWLPVTDLLECAKSQVSATDKGV